MSGGQQEESTLSDLVTCFIAAVKVCENVCSYFWISAQKKKGHIGTVAWHYLVDMD